LRVAVAAEAAAAATAFASTTVALWCATRIIRRQLSSEHRGRAHFNCVLVSRAVPAPSRQPISVHSSQHPAGPHLRLSCQQL
jgi:hypothetical protein